MSSSDKLTGKTERALKQALSHALKDPKRVVLFVARTYHDATRCADRLFVLAGVAGHAVSQSRDMVQFPNGSRVLFCGKDEAKKKSTGLHATLTIKDLT